MIPPGDMYYAVLAESPDSDEKNPFVRQDYSQAAWDDGARPEPPLTVFASWRTERREPGEHSGLLVADGDALELFIELCDAMDHESTPDAEDEDEQHAGAMTNALRYVLGLMLSRRRKLRILSTSNETMRLKVMVKDHTEYEREIDLPTPKLTAEQIERVAIQLEPALQSAASQGESQ